MVATLFTTVNKIRANRCDRLALKLGVTYFNGCADYMAAFLASSTHASNFFWFALIQPFT